MHFLAFLLCLSIHKGLLWLLEIKIVTINLPNIANKCQIIMKLQFSYLLYTLWFQVFFNIWKFYLVDKSTSLLILFSLCWFILPVSQSFMGFLLFYLKLLSILHLGMCVYWILDNYLFYSYSYLLSSTNLVCYYFNSKCFYFVFVT